MFQTAIIWSVLLASTAWLSHRWWKSWTGPCWLIIWTDVLFFALITGCPPAVGWLFLFLIVAQVLGMNFKISNRTFAVICAGCVVLAFAVSLVLYIPVYREHQRILARYPLVDLKPRLAYEHAVVPAAMQAASNSAVGSKIAALNATPQYQPFKLRELEEQIEVARYRESGWDAPRTSDAIRALSQLHEGFVADFIAQPSVFGYGRMATMKIVRESDIDLSLEEELSQPAEPIPQPTAPAETTGSPPDLAAREPVAGQLEVAGQPIVEAVASDIPSIELFENLNRRNIANFASVLGAVNDRQEARAFQPHAFRKKPSELEIPDRPSEWRLQRLELISLLKHDPPAVYVSEHLPAMNELADASTRPTTAFEVEAISQLRRGEDVVTDLEGDELRMVGAIRAVQECKKCHEVALGGLLGGFSYRFRSTKPPANPVKVTVPKPVVLRGWRLGGGNIAG